VPTIRGAVAGDNVQAVTLTLQIMERLSVEPSGLGVTALASALNTSKSRVHRHLRTLVEVGYLLQSDQTARYRVGARLIALGHTADQHFDLLDVVGPTMRTLRDTLGHTVVVSVPENDGMRVLTALTGRSDIKMRTKPGSILPYHGAAQGKVALAYIDDEMRERVFHAQMTRLTPYTIDNASALDAELKKIRARGWADSYNQTVIGTNALSAPIIDFGSRLTATIAIVDSIQLLPQRPSDIQIRSVVDAARGISRILGHADARPMNA
jgi:IclR family KDG regulon transcriptional repressor